MEAHAAFPDLEQHQRILQEVAKAVKEDVSDPPAQHNAKHPVKHQVAKPVLVHARQSPCAYPAPPQPPRHGETQQVHQAIPMDLERAKRQGDGINLMEDGHTRGLCSFCERLLCRSWR
jgi:hypothetical protein